MPGSVQVSIDVLNLNRSLTLTRLHGSIQQQNNISSALLLPGSPASSSLKPRRVRLPRQVRITLLMERLSSRSFIAWCTALFHSARLSLVGKFSNHTPVLSFACRQASTISHRRHLDTLSTSSGVEPLKTRHRCSAGRKFKTESSNAHKHLDAVQPTPHCLN
jgi:hypothetical protein